MRRIRPIDNLTVGHLDTPVMVGEDELARLSERVVEKAGYRARTPRPVAAAKIFVQRDQERVFNWENCTHETCKKLVHYKFSKVLAGLLGH